MSRTNRKSYINQPKAFYIEDEYDSSETKYYRKYKSKKVYEEEVQKSIEEHVPETVMALQTINGRLTYGPTSTAPRWVDKWDYKKRHYSKQEQAQDSSFYYEKTKRDGNGSQGKRKQWYRKDCSRSLRRDNKKLCTKILRGENYDDCIYPDRDQYKYKIWCWF